MTDLASPSFTNRSRYVPAAALVLALSAVAVWFLAGIVDDALYPVSGAVGAVAAGAGWKTRKDRTGGAKSTVALVAMIVGGLLAAEVIVFTIAWVIYHSV